MRKKEFNDKIRLNHRLLLMVITNQIKDLLISKSIHGDHKRMNRGINRRIKAIKYITQENRVMTMYELKKKFKFNIFWRR